MPKLYQKNNLLARHPLAGGDLIKKQIIFLFKLKKLNVSLIVLFGRKKDRSQSATGVVCRFLVGC